ncbi:MAG TPA: hypothetical protein VFT56_07975 [Sphingomonas sp.]|nr:hypothetical protein [Sphingomonas sp.]
MLRRRLATVPRWTWVVLALLVCIAAYFVIEDYRTRQAPPVEVSNRVLLLRRATTLLEGDPSIADIIYSSPTDQWDATPAAPDVDPRAFGRYVCFLLGQAGVAAPHTNVRVIDGAKLEAKGFDYAAASRGIVKCEEGKE